MDIKKYNNIFALNQKTLKLLSFILKWIRNVFSIQCKLADSNSKLNLFSDQGL